jgi:electron transport complex protein RnfG
MKLILRLALILGAITSIAGLGLGLIYSSAKDKIAEAEAAKTAQGLAAVLPGYEVDASAVQEADGVSYWTGKAPDGSLAYAFIAKKNGYSSEVQTMAGMDAEGRILGITVLFQQETPGLGARVQETSSSVSFWQWLTGRAPQDTGPVTPWFAEQFAGLKAKNIAIRKGQEWQAMSAEEKEQLRAANAVSALSGATITTRTISQSIEEAAAAVLGQVQGAKTVSAWSGATEIKRVSDSSIEGATAAV